MKADGETQDVTWLWRIIGQFLDDMGLYPSAVLFTKRALDILERTLGHDHRNVADDRSAEEEGKT
jgi:hypothetical protein